MRTREKPLKRKKATPQCNTNMENRDRFSYGMSVILVRSLSAKYRPDCYRRDKSVKFGTELP